MEINNNQEVPEISEKAFDDVSQSFLDENTDKAIREANKEAIEEAKSKKNREAQLKLAKISKDDVWTTRREAWRLCNETKDIKNDYYVNALNSDLQEAEHINMLLDDLINELTDSDTKKAKTWSKYSEKYDKISDLSLTLYNVAERMENNIKRVKSMLSTK